ncbi:hypothetical protein ACMU_03350 [Actibacterium mucosum KCTC 23349]|uniref:FAS1 domain-containing protein n=1 Tax=Actibacterium mucosum KCTC 23349 TaxID=1454373 RepID=A0A037ZPF4_9RHOB|nr:hypothetical protein ACMU_03350 [Actibacterium mucosum KCTC 23349]
MVVIVDALIPSSDLGSALADPHSDLTVFAPTNAAFGALAVDLGFAGDPSNENAVINFLLSNVPVTTLEAVLLYHLSSGSQTSSDIAHAGSVHTLGGGTITADLPTLVDAEPDLIDPSLVSLDIPADNGIVHVIDRVLLPVDLPGNDAPTIAGIVAASGSGFDANGADFDMLLAAVQAAGLAKTLDDAHLDLTAFAPTDQAFVDLASALGYSGTDEEGAFGYLVDALTLIGGGDPIPVLTAILQYHVAPESLQASQVLGSTQIDTLLGATIGVDGATLVDNDPDVPDPNIIGTDIQASNGVVHVLDGVLLPVDVLQSDGSNDVDLVIDGDGFSFIATGADADLIDGNGGRDFIFAGAGDDTIIGGTQNDVLFGGAGADLFIFNTGDGIDTVYGFQSGQDQIDLSNTGATSMHDIEVTSGMFFTQIEYGDEDAIFVIHSAMDAPMTEDFIFAEFFV